MNSPSKSELLQLVENSVLDAAQYLTEVLVRGDKPEVNVKKDASLVLSFDIECQKRIVKRLGKVLPLLAEEDEASHTLYKSEKSYFLIDPLDGTTTCSRFLNVKGGQVGFGPLVGCVIDNELQIASFFNAPSRTLYTAVKGEGLYTLHLENPEASNLGALSSRKKIVAPICNELVEAGVLFLVGKGGETEIIQYLKDLDAIQNIYRFGGFANDCTRLSHGYEQLTIQYAVKPWDYSAVLFAHEAGLEMIVDPNGKSASFDEWKIESNNPIIIVNRGIKEELLALLKKMPKS